MSEMKPSEVLQKALDVLGPNGEHWIKEYAAVSASGVPTRASIGTNFCALGALWSLCANPQTEQHANLLLNKVSGCRGFNLQPMAEFNDAPERTWPEVKAAFEKAIEIAKAEEA